MKLQTTDNVALDADFNHNPDSKTGIIFAHGMTVARKDEEIFVRGSKSLQQAGFSTLYFDFRAHGKSEGDSVTDFTISNELTDLTTAFEFFKNRGITQIGLAGASFGGGIAALFAGKHPQQISALFLVNPCINYDKCFLNPTTPWAKQNFSNLQKRLKKNGFIKSGSRQFKIGAELFKEMEDYQPCQKLNSYAGPLLIVHGDQDKYVALEGVKECFQSLNNPQKQMKVIEGAGHGLHEEPFQTQGAKLVTDFFKKQLSI